MPRPAPVTSARLPSRRKEGVGVRSRILDRSIEYGSLRMASCLRTHCPLMYAEGLPARLLE